MADMTGKVIAITGAGRASAAPPRSISPPAARNGCWRGARRSSRRWRKQALAIAPDAIARAVAFAIEQPADVEISSIVVRPTAQD